MRTTLLLLVAACSSSTRPIAPNTPSLVAVSADASVDGSPIDAARLVDDDEAAPPAPMFYDAIETPERCTVSALQPALMRWTDGDLLPHRDTEGGQRLEALRAAIYTHVPIGGACDVRRHDALERSIVAARAGAPAASSPWDHVSALGYHDMVAAALELSPDEETRLRDVGVVVPERLGYSDYASAYYDIHRAQLPVFVTADSMLHAVFAAHDELLGALERDVLAARLDRALGRMHCQLAAFAKSYPREVADDLDLYLTVARDLLGNQAIRGEVSAETPARAAALVSKIYAGGGLETIDLFGRQRAFDATAFVPRGHYASDEQLAQYFRSAMWLSHLELNLVSRGNRSSHPGFDTDLTETPREAVDAMALAQLAKASGALADLDAVDAAWGAFAGAREDVSLDALLDLMKHAKIDRLAIPASADRLRAAIGDRFHRTVNTFPGVEVRDLAVIATAIGPRVTPDTIALRSLPDARDPGAAAAEVGYALGQDRAAAYLPADVPPAQLAEARAAMADASKHRDMYGAWLSAIVALGAAPAGTRPSVMATDAFADLRLDSALAAYGQLRHADVLVAAQYYGVGGCEIPDGYVEPVPTVYDHLAEWARRGASAFAAIDRQHVVDGAAYFQRAERVFATLARISRDELAGRALTDDDKRFLAMIVEERTTAVQGYMGPLPVATYDGWFVDLFPDIDSAFKNASFIADYQTHIRQDRQWVDYLGAAQPTLGVFVVDTGGAPRVMVGPVARSYAAQSDLVRRFTDETADRATRVHPWSASYALAAVTEPALTVTVTRPDAAQEANRIEPGIAVDAPAALGDVTFDLRDHHFVTIDHVTATIHAGTQTIALPAATATQVESVVIHVGTFSGRIALTVARSGTRQFGAATTGDRGSRGSRIDDGP